MRKKKASEKTSSSFGYYPFEKLKKAVIPPVPSSPVEQKKTEDDDNAIFIRAMSDVKEIREFRALPAKHKKVLPVSGKRKTRDQEAMVVLSELACGRGSIDLARTQEYIEWVNPHCRNQYGDDITARLHHGEFAVKDYLDLHGYTADEAQPEIALFMKNALHQGHSCIKIIHGRGLRSPSGPVLKKIVMQFLSGKFRKHVIAFASARQCDGGLGALYVLLKHRL